MLSGCHRPDQSVLATDANGLIFLPTFFISSFLNPILSNWKQWNMIRSILQLENSHIDN